MRVLSAANGSWPPFTTRWVASPDVFNKNLLIITYDEHGGFFDRVEPQRALPPKRGMKHEDFRFDLTGVRVPAVAVSPRIAPGTVVAEDFEHSSIPRIVRSLFAPDGQALSNREAAAADVLDHLELGNVRPRAPIPLPPLLDAPPTVQEVNEFEASLLELASASSTLTSGKLADRMLEVLEIRNTLAHGNAHQIRDLPIIELQVQPSSRDASYRKLQLTRAQLIDLTDEAHDIASRLRQQSSASAASPTDD
jgi:hypothetical protein